MAESDGVPDDLGVKAVSEVAYSASCDLNLTTPSRTPARGVRDYLRVRKIH